MLEQVCFAPEGCRGFLFGSGLLHIFQKLGDVPAAQVTSLSCKVTNPEITSCEQALSDAAVS